MIELVRGNLLNADVEALVNTVNTQGYMGKGIALQFKKAFPENFKAYARACRRGEVQPGKMFVFDRGMMASPRYIINFPTKRHWREKSRLEDIEAGLKSLVEEVKQRKIKSIAIPPLGCGLGGLEWSVVRPMIETAFQTLPEVKVLLFEPVGSPSAKEMPIRTRRPKLTPARALLIKLIKQYSVLYNRLSLLELQKLAYFLQRAGEPLRLKFKKHHYGPYAHNLNKVLEKLEGHFISGYGDNQKPNVEIELLPGAIEEAERVIKDIEKESKERLNRVLTLIDGFEDPYGMELLASVHWVAVEEGARREKEAIEKIQAWSERKRKVLKPRHIKVAWQRLEEEGWLKK